MIEGGFFDLGTGSPPPKKGGKKVSGCLSCKLDRHCSTPKFPVYGDGKKKILIVNDVPNSTDDQNKTPCNGKAIKFLIDILVKNGIEWDRDCWITHAVACYPKNKNITDDSSVKFINECRPRLLKTINDLNPNVVIPLGIVSTKALIQHRTTGRFKNIKMSDFFGKQIPDQDLNAWVCPVNHPAYILKKEAERENPDPNYRKLFKNRIKSALQLAEIAPKTLQRDVHISKDVCEVKEWLKNVLESVSVVAFDYETTGLKPDREGHKIITASLAFREKDGKLIGYGFPFFQDDKEFMSLWKTLMSSDSVKKIAHKLDFESNWSNKFCGDNPKFWEWDTCLAAHCLNSKQPTTLKYHTFTEFGEIGYDDSCEKYLTSLKPGEIKKSKNSFNQIEKAPLKDLLIYNTLDSVFSYGLWEKQYQSFDEHTLKGMDFFMEGVEAFSHIQQEGMRIDVELMSKYEKRLQKRIDLYLEKLKRFNEYKKWDGNKSINLNSDTQISKLLYTILNYKVPEGCENSKTGAKALEKIGTAFSLNVLQYRRSYKLLNTYIAQFKREHINGIVRAFFNLHIPSTFRSSSDSPNFQNFPKRREDAKIIRDLVRPRPGNRLIEYDYKAVEVAIGACYHKDPQMIKYIKDPSNNMHTDMAAEIFLKATNEVDSKTERNIIKNTYVFPAFYGSSVKPEYGKTIGNITRNIWENITGETKKHLRNNNIKTLRKFQSHMEEIDWSFWNERFPVYNQWKEDIYNDYRKKGYIELYTGFRCYGPLAFTEATNYQIQGTAFHILLETLIHSHKKIKEISKRSSIIGQIHDAIIVDAHPDDEEDIDTIIYHYGVRRPLKKYDWIIVPLSIEKERSEIDGRWSEMHDCGFIGV